MSEAEYLELQARAARNAMNEVIGQIKTLARESSDPRPYVEQFPWLSMGAAAVAGFIVGTALTPARGQSMAERLSSLMPAGAAGGRHKSSLRFVTTPLLRIARTAVVSAISSAAARAAAGETPSTDQPSPPPEAPPAPDAGT